MEFFISGEIDGSAEGEKDHIPKKFSSASTVVNEKIAKFLHGKSYGSEVDSIVIVPIVMNLPKSYQDAGWHKERKLFKRKTKAADFRLKIDYFKFRDASEKQCELLVLKNVVDSIKILSERAKKDFRGKDLENDILKLFGKKYSELENI